MRPRNKAKEVQPAFKFNHKTQGERLFETLTKDTPLYFTIDEITGGCVDYNHNGCPIPEVKSKPGPESSQ